MRIRRTKSKSGALGFLLYLIVGTVLVDAAETVPFSRIAADYGLRVWWREDGTVSLFDAKRQLDAGEESREIRFNGIRVHLGGELVLIGDSPGIASADWATTVRPLIESAGRDPGIAALVWLDPGHGGKDPGASPQGGPWVEKDLTLDIATRLAARLRAQGYRVVLSRETDVFLELGERTRLARAAGADLFVSIHFNAWPTPDVEGLESFALSPGGQPSTGEDGPAPAEAEPGNRFDEENIRLAYFLQRELVVTLGGRDRGVKRARFGVLKDPGCPAALVELGFLSHPPTAANLGNDAERERIVGALARGIARFAGPAAASE